MATAKNKAAVNREDWLTRAVDLIGPLFKEAGLLTPPVSVSVGFPSRRALSNNNRTIGQCFDLKVSSDKRHQIFISPVIGDSLEALAVLVHEYVHASIGTEEQHGPAFKRAMGKVGLEGKPTATYASEELHKRLTKDVLRILGPYPHPALNPSSMRIKKDGTRMLKLTCPECGYVIRTTKKWIEVGVPTCVCGTDFEWEGGEEDDE